METIVSYFIYGLNYLLDRGWQNAVFIYWHFLLLELPRYVLTDILVLAREVWPRRRAESGFAERLLAHKTLVSVIIPCHNEEASILKTIRSLQTQSYPHLQIIVVDDGSDDRTPQVCAPLARAGEIVYLRNSLRGGKSSAANLGLKHCRGEYVISVDADTTFDGDAIWQMLDAFADPGVGAVSGNIRVRNRRENLLTRLQAIHYLISISVGRIASHWLNILLIVSGAFGGFRRGVIEQVGGWDVGPGEDADLTLKSKLQGSRIGFAPRAICLTEVPATISGFVKQQRRWNRSIIRFRLRKYAHLLNPLRPEFDLPAFLGSLDILIYQVILGYSFIFYLGWLAVYHRPIMLWVLASTYLLYLLSAAFQLAIAWLLSERKAEDIRLFLYLPLYPFFSGYFLRFIRVYAYTEELLFRTSYSDPQVPQRILNQTHRW
jgi:cellulose synthase/poly-beta-1,6-N-acetylglucosamine synthase-like glycosyltransferase